MRKSKISPSVIYPISGDRDNLGMANLAKMSLMKCYIMLQDVMVAVFDVSELL